MVGRSGRSSVGVELEGMTMDLYSCRCGVVLNRDVMVFPSDIYDSLGDIDEDAAVWDGDMWVPKAKCPACKADVPGRP